MFALKQLLSEYVEKYEYDYKKIREIYCECDEQDYIEFMKILKEEEN